jgi:hypothetical protein
MSSYGYSVSSWEHASQHVSNQRELALRDAPQWVLDSIRDYEQRTLTETNGESPHKEAIRRRRYY